MERMERRMPNRNHPHHKHPHGRHAMKKGTMMNMNMPMQPDGQSTPSADAQSDESKPSAEGLVNEDFFSAEGPIVNKIHWPSVALGAGIVVGLFFLHKKLKIKI